MFTSFVMTEHWLKQPQILPRHIAVKYQTVKMHQPPQYSCKYKPSLTDVGMSLDQVKYTCPCLPAFIIAEHVLKHQPKILPQTHCCQVPKNEDVPTTTILLEINLP